VSGEKRAPALVAQDIQKRYGGREVVAVEYLSAEEGEVLGVLGPNGAGKSTLFRILALLERPDSGALRHFGHRVDAGDLHARRRIASVFQRPMLFQGNVRRNVEFGLRLRHVKKDEREAKAEWALGVMGISSLAEAYSNTLSGGELQRVSLARALVLEPQILFLDEPTSNLDGDVRRRFRDDLRRAVKELATTVVLITHDQAEAFSLADRVAVMREGRIVQQGEAREVFERPRDSFVARFTGVETMWRGRVDSCAEGLCSVTTAGGLHVELISRTEVRVGQEVALAMRPEDVALSVSRVGASTTTSPFPSQSMGASERVRAVESGFVSSVRNRWLGTVESLFAAGPLVRVGVRLTGGDMPESRLVALVTRPAADSLDLEPGRAVTASVKATALHLLDDNGESWA
jgi:molybdopterin-binding protein